MNKVPHEQIIKAHKEGRKKGLSIGEIAKGLSIPKWKLNYAVAKYKKGAKDLTSQEQKLPLPTGTSGRLPDTWTTASSSSVYVPFNEVKTPNNKRVFVVVTDINNLKEALSNLI